MGLKQHLLHRITENIKDNAFKALYPQCSVSLAGLTIIPFLQVFILTPSDKSEKHIMTHSGAPPFPYMTG